VGYLGPLATEIHSKSIDIDPSSCSQSDSTRHQLFIDSLDVWLPASALGLVDLNDGVVGILGFVLSPYILDLQTMLICYQFHLVCHGTGNPVEQCLFEVTSEVYVSYQS
jgi:hypothetical protein